MNTPYNKLFSISSAVVGVLLASLVVQTAAPVKSTEGENRIIPLADKVDLEMIWIKPGTFTMGSPEDELGRFDDEVQHQVTLTRGYWLGKYEVTQAQYKAVMGTNPSP